jgi:hypothetical protein
MNWEIELTGSCFIDLLWDFIVQCFSNFYLKNLRAQAPSPTQLLKTASKKILKTFKIKSKMTDFFLDYF